MKVEAENSLPAARVLLNGRLLFAKYRPAVDFAVREFIFHGNPTFCRLKALIKGSDQEDHTRRRHKEMTFRAAICRYISYLGNISYPVEAR